MIKFIGFKIEGHTLFDDNTEFTIATSGQITSKTKKRVIQFNNTLTLNRTIGIVGLNATGKTTLMKIFEGLSDLYLLDLSIDQTFLADVLRSDNNKIKVTSFLASTDNDSYKIETEFIKKSSPKVEIENDEWIINNEKVFEKKNYHGSKIKYFNFDGIDPVKERVSLDEESKKILSNKDSIFRIITNSTSFSSVASTLSITDINIAKSFRDQTPKELLEYLDSSIEYFKYVINDDNKVKGYELKFINSKTVYTFTDFTDSIKYLSSGTVKGITLFFKFFNALRFGSTLLVDEIEMHINRRIVQDFIGFFADDKVNINNATLVYSTHYIELTDNLFRNDEEYVLTRLYKTNVHRLINEKIRVEIKKSEIFQNNYIEGTAPSYKRYRNLKKAIISHNHSTNKDVHSSNKEEK